MLRHCFLFVALCIHASGVLCHCLIIIIFFYIKSEFSKYKKIKIKLTIYCFCSSATVHRLYQAKKSAI